VYSAKTAMKQGSEKMKNAQKSCGRRTHAGKIALVWSGDMPIPPGNAAWVANSTDRPSTRCCLAAPGDFSRQPGSGVGPMVDDRTPGDPLNLGHLIDGQSRKVTELHEVRNGRLRARESRQRFIKSQKIIARAFGGWICVRKPNPLSVSPMFRALPSPGSLDKNSAHGLGRRGEEVAPTVPALRLVSNEAEIRFMDKSRRLQCLAGWLVGELLSRQQPQFFVDQRQELVRSPGVSPLHGVQDTSDVTHAQSLSCRPSRLHGHYPRSTPDFQAGNSHQEPLLLLMARGPHPGPRTTWPLVAPVCSPSLRTCVPFTKTWITPVAYWQGLS